MHDVLERLTREAQDLTDYLSATGQLSLLNNANDSSRKMLILSAASLFEHRITEALLAYADHASNSDLCIVSIIRNKAVKRQYHTYFDWDKWQSAKISTFCTLLGDNLGGELKQACSGEMGRDEAAAFLEVGQIRNCLVHQNFAEYVIDKSLHEICTLCGRADNFVERVERLLALRVPA